MKYKHLRIYTILGIVIIMVAIYILTHRRLVSSEPITKTGFALDTFISITIYDKSDEALLDEAMELCENYDKVFSAHREDSELYSVNHRNSSRIKVSRELADIINKGLEYGELSGGAFDISIEPVKELWDFKAENAKLPDAKLLEEALADVDYTSVRVDGEYIEFDNSGTKLDFGAIAKGYIADRIKETLIKSGVKSAIINLGGNVLCIGHKPSGEDFIIGIQDPDEARNSTVGVVHIDDMSVVSSGIYERFIDVEGVRYHHILNPDTGYPYDNGIAGVSIVSKESVVGDALSTACLSLGAKEGMKLIDSTDGVYGYIILKDGTVLSSENAEELSGNTD